MSTAFTSPRALEPFPLFIDSAPPNSANYFSSPIAMAAVQLVAAASSSTSASSTTSVASLLPSSLKRPTLVIHRRLSNYVRLRYYQYEVTFGVYMMTPREKWIFNAVILSIAAMILYAATWGMRAFLVGWLCRLIWYLVGDGAGNSVLEVCAKG
ncbi:hypothetical protein LTR84_005359 [Exophiala bonariae]|uniref:PRA1 family protein n=1 Tax=Exophiala bonariae TaxID=1690606 RepID=A0AAV9N3M7_9EURO|nr:hypothetical protein LTR84_005359 [Exophiala bonariae]